MSWIHQMRVLAAYGLQFGRYRITQMAKQKKKQYDNTNDIFLGENLGVASRQPLLSSRIRGLLR